MKEGNILWHHARLEMCYRFQGNLQTRFQPSMEKHGDSPMCIRRASALHSAAASGTCCTQRHTNTSPPTIKNTNTHKM